MSLQGTDTSDHREQTPDSDPLNERIKVVAHDPDWTRKFDSEAVVLRDALGSALVALHHIGSTSIPGICAKPVIDVLAEIDSLDGLDERAHRMVEVGYEAMGEYGIPGRRYFRRDDARGVRETQVHAFVTGSEAAVRHLAFRDYLRANPAVAQEYSELKLRLASRHPTNMEAYMDGKNPFIRETERVALAWRRSSARP